MAIPCWRHLGIGTVIAVAAACLGTGAWASSIPAFNVAGRLFVNEPHSCDGGNGDLTANTLLSWTECHAWKKHMDASGALIRTNAFVAGALRPLSMTVDVEVWCAYGPTTSDAAPVARARTQTSTIGKFRVGIPGADCGVPSLKATGVVVRVTALMQYDMSDAAGYAGTIRGLWDRTLGATVYRSVLPPDPSVYTDSYGDWVIPHFILTQQVLDLPVPDTLDIGNQVFFDGAAPDYYDYLRGALGTWETVVTLHRKLQAALAVDGHDALYRRIFVTDPWLACTTCYTLGFNNPHGGGVGGVGGFSVPRPIEPTPEPTYEGMVSVGLPAHEFGHSMHGTIAAGSFATYDGTIFTILGPTGDIDGYHHPYDVETTLQQQESMVAYIEGFGDAMGAYFLNGCRMADHGWGDPDPLHNSLNPAYFASCDGGPGCPYGAFRYNMVSRGIAEGSALWNTRLASLTDLANQAAAAGATFVITNNELKVRAFICDLLDSDPDVSYATGQIAGRTYVPDYTWLAAERLDGRTPSPTFATYASDPGPENVTISLGTLLTAMDNFIPGLHAYPPIYPDVLWIAPMITDGANGPYDDVRISIHGAFSPQQLGLYLVGMGAVTHDDLNNIFRANRMEEVP